MTQTNLSKFNNDWYKPGANPIKRLCWYYTNAIWINSAFPISSVKVSLLRLFGAKMGHGVVIKPHVNIKYPWKLEVGNNVWIGEYVWIDNLAQVTIEDNVCISQGALLLCGNHNYKKESFDLIVGEIKLEKGVWIGAKTTVCPSVTCHAHAVLAVGSVANFKFRILQNIPRKSCSSYKRTKN
jgi:putative colanic acid biosynthesis acetyltransferase WcaF